MATPAEIAASLTMDEIPVKLRCASCNKLANNAFRLPCCDQSVCEDCQASLPVACPVCLHEPMVPDDCRPNKALRTTIKVFLKKKVMERETARKKEALDKASATPATPATPLPDQNPIQQSSEAPALPPIPAIVENCDTKPGSRDVSRTPQGPDDGGSKIEGSIVPTDAQKDIPQESIESPGAEIPRRASTQTTGDGSVVQEKADDNEKQMEQQQQQQQSMGQNEQWAQNNMQGTNIGGFGFDGTNSGFPNMGFNGIGDFNSMMPFLPNGMPNPMMGAFPNMMGMPGMGMDPMAMTQGMYGGFGRQGMGMNGMNMGMGFNNAGQGAFGGGFNGQPAAWNAGQDKFNQNAYGGQAGIGGGDFGANTGYGGYNMPPHQGNFNQMHQHQYPNNDFHHGHHGQGFQYRGRGRGRGYLNAGRGRGGYNHNFSQGNQNQKNANYEPFHQQMPAQVTRRGSPTYGPTQDQPFHEQEQEPTTTGSQQAGKTEDNATGLTAEEQLNKELDPGDAEENNEKPPESSFKEEQVKEEQVAPPAEESAAQAQAHEEIQPETAPEMKEEKSEPIPSIVSDEPSKPELPAVDASASNPPTMMPPPSPMIPTGPSALLADQALDTSPRGRGAGRGFYGSPDYRGGSRGRGSVYPPHNSFPRVTPPVVKAVVPPSAPKGLGVEGAPKAPKALREGQPNTGIKGFSIVGRASVVAQSRPNDSAANRSPSRERSRSPIKHQSSHHRHHRHRSTSPSDDSEYERRRERHRRHSRRYEDENGDMKEHKGSRARVASADSSTKRSSHRSRRDYEKERDGDRSSHRSHRSHRDRSREDDKEHRSNRKRSKSPEIAINGASRRSVPSINTHTNGHTKTHEEPSQPSRKRRSDDEDYDDHRRERKRSRRDHEDSAEEKETTSHRSSRPSKRDIKEPRSNHDRSARGPPPTQEKEQDKERQDDRKPVVDAETTTMEKPKSPPKGPKIDQHAREREARNAERVAREEQRKLRAMGAAVAGGKGPAQGGGGSGRVNGKGGGGGAAAAPGGLGGRRMSYKYEDEEATLVKGESEREASRYR